jgi:prepilin-type N-terminal cleavage/methylation domain-containing protein
MRERKPRTSSGGRYRRSGFTLIELMIGSTVMLMVIVGALTLYMRSNKITVDQQQFAHLQHDVRSAMFFVSRDIRSSGVGLETMLMGYFIEGWDNEDQGGSDVTPDRIRIMGNIEDPLDITIENYQGSSANAALVDFSLESYHYPDEYYDNAVVLMVPNPESGCITGEVRVITSVTHSATGGNERFNFSPGLAPGIDPPGGLSGTCADSDDWDGGSIHFVQVKEYWLDVDGTETGLTAGEAGYIGAGVGGILYMTQNAYHYPIAQNVENFQLEYNGDFDNDGFLDGFQPYNAVWTGDPDMIGRIHQVRILILGRTPRRFLSVSGTPPGGLAVYRRPVLSNTPAETEDDLHRRFMLESTVGVRNMTLGIYNTGER